MGDENPLAPLSLLTLYGGSSIASGESFSFTTNLKAGDYLLIEFDESGASTSDLTTFTVSEADMASGKRLRRLMSPWR